MNYLNDIKHAFYYFLSVIESLDAHLKVFGPASDAALGCFGLRI